ncbi:conserved hypothetical protein [Burkholderiales bacterium]|nr:conserved hypothetical protein [Burkholderiales bacterium]
MSVWEALARAVRGTPPAAAHCGACRHFCNDPLLLEQRTPGLPVLSSGFAAARADDGLCSAHSRYLPAYAVCNRFQRRIQANDAPTR